MPEIDVRPFFVAGFAVKAIKTWPTHDGGGYHYRLLHHGKPVALVRNDGWGGETDIDWIGLRRDGTPQLSPDATPREAAALARAAQRAMVARDTLESMTATIPPLTYEGRTLTVDVGWIAEEILSHEQLRRHCRRQTCLRLPEHDPNTYSSVNARWGDEVRAWVQAHHPDAVVLNEWIDEPVAVPPHRYVYHSPREDRAEHNGESCRLVAVLTEGCDEPMLLVALESGTTFAGRPWDLHADDDSGWAWTEEGFAAWISGWGWHHDGRRWTCDIQQPEPEPEPAPRLVTDGVLDLDTLLSCVLGRAAVAATSEA